MRSKGNAWALALCAALLAALAATSQAAIIETNFVSAPDPIGNQNLNGTTVGLITNQPGGTWVFGAGWNWSQPFVPATWMGGYIKNVAYMAEEKVALGISIASNGSYFKPGMIQLSADVLFDGSRTHTAGVGFFSVMPPRTDNVNQFAHFTGLYINEQNDTLQVMADGALVGAAVGVGPVLESTWYRVNYGIDTGTGGLLNVTFGGNPIAGLSSTGFTNAATAFAAIVVGGGSRVVFDNLVMAEIIPEPASLTLLGLGGLLLARKRRRR